MFRLTREVRFAINSTNDPQLHEKPTNSFSGYPTLVGLSRYFVIKVSLEGELQRETQYLRNIKDIDEVIRKRAVVATAKAVDDRKSPEILMQKLYSDLLDQWPGCELAELELFLSPYLSIGCRSQEFPMVRLSQKFEFSASHRLHNDALSEDENYKTYGKCNNPHGHGHNYELQVNLVGEPDANGQLIDLIQLERTVNESVVDRLDHRYLNEEISEFRKLIPTVENIAKVVFGWLKPSLQNQRAALDSVIVWETGKTSCEYSE